MTEKHDFYHQAGQAGAQPAYTVLEPNFTVSHHKVFFLPAYHTNSAKSAQ